MITFIKKFNWLNLHIIIYLNVRNILINEIVFFESYCSYWTFDLRKIYYYLAVQTLISIQILLFLWQCINIFHKVNDFYKIPKTQIHHVIFYLECNLQFPFFSSSSFNFQLFCNVKWIEYVLMTICNFSCNRLI